MAEETQDINRTLKQFLNVAIRRRRVLVPVACGVAIAVVLLSLLLPNHYDSEATILVVQQQVPQRYVVPNTTYSIQEAIESLTEAVLSRTRLLPMISEFGLYPQEKQRLGPEGLVELMRSNIQITPVEKDPSRREVNAFKISFTAGNPIVAQKVTERLTSFFIDENLKLQEQQDTGTTSFLKDQLASTQRELEAQEQQLRDYKTRYLGELPEQQQGNLEILSGLHMQLQNTMAELSRAQEQRVYLSSLLDQYRALSTTGGPIPGLPAQSPVAAAQNELNRLRAEKASLLARYTPQYPDVLQINRKIADQEALLESLNMSKSKAGKKGAMAAKGLASTAESSSVAQLNSQLDANRVQMRDLAKGEKQLEAEIAQYEQRLNLTPVREQQLSDILRNYNLAKKNYADLLNKVTQSEMATRLAMRQQGQQFRVVDPPSLPGKPSSPNRVKIGLAGAVGGLFLAAILAFLVDSGDHSFYSEKDVSQKFKLPLVIGVPLFFTPSEERKRSLRNAFEWLAGTALVLMVLAAEFYIYRRG